MLRTMASIRERVRKEGTTGWAVLWRDADSERLAPRQMDSSG